MNSSCFIVVQISVQEESLRARCLRKLMVFLKNQLTLVREVIYSSHVLFLRNIYQRNSLISLVVGGAVVTSGAGVPVSWSPASPQTATVVSRKSVGVLPD